MNFDIFLRKELKELLKNFRGIVLLAVFLFTAVSAPIMARFTPDILMWAFNAMDEPTDMSAFIGLFGEPSSVSGFTQFFSDFTTLGLFAFIIIFGGIVAKEKSKGTAAYILTKSVSRTEFILSKFVASVLFIFAATAVTAGVLKLASFIIFNDGLIHVQDFILYFALLFLYLVFIMSIIMFASVIAKSTTPATIFSFLIFAAFNIWAMIPRAGRFAPPNINNLNVLANDLNTLNAHNSTDLTVGIILTVAFSICFLISSIALFNRQEL